MAQSKKVKVAIGYSVTDDSITLYGIKFNKSGAKGKEKYVAECDLADVESLIDSEKLTVVK